MASRPTWVQTDILTNYEMISNPNYSQGILMSTKNTVLSYKEEIRSECAFFNSIRINNSQNSPIPFTPSSDPISYFGGSYTDYVVARSYVTDEIGGGGSCQEGTECADDKIYFWR